jgi:hypothetical protein
MIGFNVLVQRHSCWVGHSCCVGDSVSGHSCWWGTLWPFKARRAATTSAGGSSDQNAQRSLKELTRTIPMMEIIGRYQNKAGQEVDLINGGWFRASTPPADC